MSITSGIRSGLRSTMRAGVNPGAAAVADADATSGIYVPSSAAQYTALGLTAPDALWLMQEASGNLADSIGAIPLAPGGTVTYDNALAGWSRKFVGTSDGVAGYFNTMSASLPNPASASILVLLYANVTAIPAAIRQLLEMFTGPNGRIRINTTPRTVLYLDPASATGTANPVGAVRPYVFKYDFTNSLCSAYTDQEKLSVAFSAEVGKSLLIGGSSVPPTARYGYAASWFNAAAEMSDASVKSMLQTLGWTIPWT